MTFNQLLQQKNFILLDGAMGTMLQSAGLETGALPELFGIHHPEVVTDIHRQYINAGADIIYANTFGANRHKLHGSGYTPKQVIEAAVQNAKAACRGTQTLVALDIGPTGLMLEPTGTLSFHQAYDLFAEQIEAGGEADVIVIETMSDLYEARAALLAAKECSRKPVICTMTFEKNRRTFTGCSVSAMALTLQGLGADAIGMNCSLGPDELLPLVQELSRWTDLPIVVKPNAGLPNLNSQTYDVPPAEFAAHIAALIPYGVKAVGGCCGTTPQYIQTLADALKSQVYQSASPAIPAAVCCPTNTVVIDRPRIIGERLNPTGKKRLKEALLHGDMDYLLSQAVEQIRAGADLLDVNVGLPDVDEAGLMTSAVKALQGVVDVPLQIDSSNPEVLEAALRIYNGKAIVNSVNGEEASLSAVLPLVKKYGAAVVGLTLDENGIPASAEKRFQIAKRILDRAKSYGIPKRDVYIDCLTLTASAEQAGAAQTLRALRRVKEELELKTVLGVSNISFGLPNRELLNSTFLTMALSNGLDLPIINPNIASMTGAVRAYHVLMNIDQNSAHYIEAYGCESKAAHTSAAQPSQMDLTYAIENGLKKEGGQIVKQLLQHTAPLDIVNNLLIPALDKAGLQFEQGKTFLPQLILSAEVAQAAFEEIKKSISHDASVQPMSKGKILLATVKGDIHDIGKNIVKVLLDNYGYTVVDLGHDVDPQLILSTAVEQNITLIGLSALMTTTLKSMEATIQLLRQRQVDCTIMVGGAVLTPDYAKKIGADYYAKDAKESVDIAKKVLG